MDIVLNFARVRNTHCTLIDWQKNKGILSLIILMLNGFRGLFFDLGEECLPTKLLRSFQFPPVRFPVSSYVHLQKTTNNLTTKNFGGWSGFCYCMKQHRKSWLLSWLQRFMRAVPLLLKNAEGLLHNFRCLWSVLWITSLKLRIFVISLNATLFNRSCEFHRKTIYECNLELNWVTLSCNWVNGWLKTGQLFHWHWLLHWFNFAGFVGHKYRLAEGFGRRTKSSSAFHTNSMRGLLLISWPSISRGMKSIMS